MNRHLVSCLIPMALFACKPEDEPPPVGDRFDLLEAVAWDLSPGIGGAPASAYVRAVNEWGVPVAAADKTVQVGGFDQTVVFDGAGYGRALLAEMGTASVSVDGGDPVQLHATGEDWPGFGAMPAGPGLDGVLSARAVSGGLLATTENEVWWVGYDGETHRVLSLPNGDPIAGMTAVHLDTDGVSDALVWGGANLVALRGRHGGGMTWGAGFKASNGMYPGGASAGDTDGDGIPDLVVSWTDGTAGVLEVQHGDGTWGFVPAPRIPLTTVPVSLAIGDNSGEGREQITQIVSTGTWQRFVVSEGDRYSGTGPNLTLVFPEGATVESGFDYNGDGGDEIVVLGPRQPGQDRQVFLYDLVGLNASYLTLTPLSAFMAFGDANLDGLADVWLFHETLELWTLTWNGTDNTQRRVVNLPAHAPFGAADQTGDGIPEVGLAASDWTTWWTGGIDDSEATVWWDVAEPYHVVADIDLFSPMVVANLDGNAATVEVVAYEIEGQRLFLSAWQIPQGDEPTPTAYGRAEISDSGALPLDLAVCGPVAFALTDEGVARVDWTGGTATLGAQRTIAASRISCGAGPSASVAAVLVTDAVHLVGLNLATIGSPEAHAAAQDVAIVRLGSGAGTADVVTCDTAGCSIVAWDYGDAGTAAYTTASGIEVFDGTNTVTLAGGGNLFVDDVDGDGNDDLLAQEERMITVYRSTGSGFGVPESFHVLRDIEGSAQATDVTGDGKADLLYVDEQADLVFTLEPGYEPAMR